MKKEDYNMILEQCEKRGRAAIKLIEESGVTHEEQSKIADAVMDVYAKSSMTPQQVALSLDIILTAIVAAKAKFSLAKELQDTSKLH